MKILQSIPNEYQKWWDDLNPLFKDKKRFPEWEMLSPDQFIAVKLILSGQKRLITLCGSGGSGKSFTVMFCKKLLEVSNREVLMLASTGIAAYLVNGQTLASACALGAHNDIIPDGISDRFHPNVYPQRKYNNKDGSPVYQKYSRQTIDKIVRKIHSNGLISKDYKAPPLVIFIEEVGMCSSQDLYIAKQAIYKHLGYNKKNTRVRDIQFVFLGDYRQLLAVPTSSITPWDIYTDLAFEEARFDELHWDNNEGSIEYFNLQHVVPNPLGYKTDEGLFVSLITNHRQKQDEVDFINELNKLGKGETKFSLNEMPTIIASKVFCFEEGEYYNWVDSLRRVNTLLDYAEIEHEALHVMYTNADVARRNNTGVRHAMEFLQSKYGTNINNYYRDYPISIETNGDSSEIEKKVLTDISPTGVTIVDKDDIEFTSIVNEHRNVPIKISKDGKLTTLGYQRVVVGMKWMCRKNISAHLKNGTTCIVTCVTDTYFMVMSTTDTTKQQIRVDAQTELFCSLDNRGRPIAVVKGVPGHPAFGVTFHKTQGMTVTGCKLVLHLDPILINFAIKRPMHGLFYVGLSRVCSSEQLVILYKSNYPVIDGLNALSRAEKRVFEFIDHCETTMRDLLTLGETTSTTTLDVLEEEKIDLDLFSCERPIPGVQVFTPDEFFK